MVTSFARAKNTPQGSALGQRNFAGKMRPSGALASVYLWPGLSYIRPRGTMFTPTSGGTVKDSTSTSMELVLSPACWALPSSALSALSLLEPLDLESLSLEDSFSSFRALENLDSWAPPERISTAISTKIRPLKDTPSPKPSFNSW
ncbi:hypothetical protein LEMLEM_LOCUS11105 [Lemmus lemmus]